MAKQINENWRIFQVHLDTLFAAIREVYQRASEATCSDDGGEERLDSRASERAIDILMARCELQIRRAVTGPFKLSELEQNSALSALLPKLPRKKTSVKEYAQRIDAANLTDSQREVFLMHIERGMSFRSIATRLSKDESTIREHYKAALEKFGGEHER
jgi:DNA-binding NarL/FixJ family response regulator